MIAERGKYGDRLAGGQLAENGVFFAVDRRFDDVGEKGLPSKTSWIILAQILTSRDSEGPL